MHLCRLESNFTIHTLQDAEQPEIPHFLNQLLRGVYRPAQMAESNGQFSIYYSLTLNHLVCSSTLMRKPRGPMRDISPLFNQYLVMSPFVQTKLTLYSGSLALMYLRKTGINSKSGHRGELPQGDELYE